MQKTRRQGSPQKKRSESESRRQRRRPKSEKGQHILKMHECVLDAFDGLEQILRQCQLLQAEGHVPRAEEGYVQRMVKVRLRRDIFKGLKRASNASRTVLEQDSKEAGYLLTIKLGEPEALGEVRAINMHLVVAKYAGWFVDRLLQNASGTFQERVLSIWNDDEKFRSATSSAVDELSPILDDIPGIRMKLDQEIAAGLRTLEDDGRPQGSVTLVHLGKGIPGDTRRWLTLRKASDWLRKHRGPRKKGLTDERLRQLAADQRSPIEAVWDDKGCKVIGVSLRSLLEFDHVATAKEDDGYSG